LAELAAGFFYLSDLREIARRVFSVRLRFESGGNLTHVDKRITVRKTDVDFSKMIDEAVKRGADRRNMGAIRTNRLCADFAARQAAQQHRARSLQVQREDAAIASIGATQDSSSGSEHG